MAGTEVADPGDAGLGPSLIGYIGEVTFSLIGATALPGRPTPVISTGMFIGHIKLGVWGISTMIPGRRGSVPFAEESRVLVRLGLAMYRSLTVRLNCKHIYFRL